jgi:ectoine hydroxylase-related dioxygenase (phytanoyl-CoA dioxygenase family)
MINCRGSRRRGRRSDFFCLRGQACRRQNTWSMGTFIVHARQALLCLHLLLLGASLATAAFLTVSTKPEKRRDTITWRATRSGSSRRNKTMVLPEQGRVTLKQNKEDMDAIISIMGFTRAPSKKETTQKSRQGTAAPAGNALKDNQSRKFDKLPQISLQTQLDYARNGHAVLRNFVDSTTLRQIRTSLQRHASEQELKAWQQKVQVASNSAKVAESCRTVQQCQEQLASIGITASLPFLQYFNLWKSYPEIKGLAYSLGQAASVLLDVPTVRLYQDALFWKRRNDGPTPWHVDARMAPFDTSHILTLWIPLQDIPPDGTALTFCSKSHIDFALPYWNALNNDEWDRLEDRYPKKLVDYMPMTVGDITVHSGWTLHSANDNACGDKDRMALAISYVDGNAELRPDVHEKSGGKGDNEDHWSYKDWVQDVSPRTRFQHDQVPIVWPPKE